MKTDSALINLVVVLLFVFINPLYALSICAILNYKNYGINFSLFSIMFASSFGLFFFMRNWNIGYDAMHFLNTFREANSYSLTDFFKIDLSQSGMEPLWHVYLWLSRIIIGDHVDFFAFFILFTIFFLMAYLGKVIDEKRFVVVIACILFINRGFFTNAYEVWRHTFALLFFFIGIFLLEAGRHRRLARGLMYSAPLFHFVIIPILASYEILTLIIKRNARSQINTRFQTLHRYSTQIVVYVILTFVIMIWANNSLIGEITSRLTAYQSYLQDVGGRHSGISFLFNPLTAALIYYFWFNRKQISPNDLFIGINYFIVISAFIMGNLPSSPLGRVNYIFLVGASVLSAKLVLKEEKQGFLFLFIIILFMFYTNIKHGGGNLMYLVDGDYFNPTHGLLSMILNYSGFLPSRIL